MVRLTAFGISMLLILSTRMKSKSEAIHCVGIVECVISLGSWHVIKAAPKMAKLYL